MDSESDNSKFPTAQIQSKTYTDTLSHYLTLTLSVPERAARALSAMVGGSVLLLSNTLVPRSLKSTSSYRFTLGMFQTFLIRNMAGLDYADSEPQLKNNFINRKLLGTSLEAAGLLTMHFSPVWVFAIAADTAKGGQIFLQRLVHNLKENQVIPEDSHPQSLEQILQSIHEMGLHSATAIDTPPLNLEEIRELANELRKATASLTQNSVNMLPSFEKIWNQIDAVARKENMSPAQIFGILSVSAASVAETGLGTVSAVGETGIGLIDEMILGDYSKTLTEISNEGGFNYMKNHMQPFISNAQSHFDFDQETSSQRWFKRTFEKFAARLNLSKK